MMIFEPDRLNDARFPFGEPLRRVLQTDRSPKRIFVLGVYASAVHAQWVRDGREVIKALAVASEPYIFWRGEASKCIIDGIKIPKELGSLEPADEKFSGPSGIALDQCFLKPLGLERAHAWLCDLVPYSCVNNGQHAAIVREYMPLQQRYSLNLPTIPMKPRVLADDARRSEIVSEIRDSKAKTLILLGDEPIQWFLSKFDTRRKKLSDFKPYGHPHSVELDGMKIDVLPLVHPRQAAGLGPHSAEWRAKHDQWMREIAPTLTIR